MYLFSFVSDISTNEVFTFHKAMKQNDKLGFVAAMEKERFTITSLVVIGQ